MNSVLWKLDWMLADDDGLLKMSELTDSQKRGLNFCWLTIVKQCDWGECSCCMHVVTVILLQYSVWALHLTFGLIGVDMTSQPLLHGGGIMQFHPISPVASFNTSLTHHQLPLFASHWRTYFPYSGECLTAILEVWFFAFTPVTLLTHLTISWTLPDLNPLSGWGK